MAEMAAAKTQPPRSRVIGATIATLLVVVIVWKVIDYRTQPPPPPVHASTAPAPSR